MNMRNFDALIDKLREDFPGVRFEEAEVWRSGDRVVGFVAGDENGELLLLHELAHIVLRHESYTRDVELVRMEMEAWEEVKSTLAPRYGVEFKAELAESQLDTYREWLDKRSRCPKCNYTGWQVNSAKYQCPLCRDEWRVGNSVARQVYRQKS